MTEASSQMRLPIPSDSAWVPMFTIPIGLTGRISSGMSVFPAKYPAELDQRGGLDHLAEETEGGTDGIGERLAGQPHRLPDAHRPKGDLRRHPQVADRARASLLDAAGKLSGQRHLGAVALDDDLHRLARALLDSRCGVFPLDNGAPVQFDDPVTALQTRLRRRAR